MRQNSRERLLPSASVSSFAKWMSASKIEDLTASNPMLLQVFRIMERKVRPFGFLKTVASKSSPSPGQISVAADSPREGARKIAIGYGLSTMIELFRRFFRVASIASPARSRVEDLRYQYCDDVEQW